MGALASAAGATDRQIEETPSRVAAECSCTSGHQLSLFGICSLRWRGEYAKGVNKVGNAASLVASHPGNRSAVQHGAYSGGLMLERAAEIEAALVADYVLSPT